MGFLDDLIRGGRKKAALAAKEVKQDLAAAQDKIEDKLEDVTADVKKNVVKVANKIEREVPKEIGRAHV